MEFEKWKESGNHKSSEKHLGKNPRFSERARCLALEVLSLRAVPTNETLLIAKAALLIPSDSPCPRHGGNLATELCWPAQDDGTSSISCLLTHSPQIQEPNWGVPGTAAALTGCYSSSEKILSWIWWFFPVSKLYLKSVFISCMSILTVLLFFECQVVFD